MGQWYSIDIQELKVKEGKLQELLEAVKEYVSDPDLRIFDAVVNSIKEQTTLKGIIENIYGPFNIIEYDDDRYWEDDQTWHANFKGSYGWENIMYQAFKVMAPYLVPGSALCCYPDEGEWTLVVQEDGSVVEIN